MSSLKSVVARVGAIAVLLALVVGPPVLVARLIGRPYPEWSTLTDQIESGQVSADTVMRIAALLFIAIWIWIVSSIATEIHRLTTSTTHASRFRRTVITEPKRTTMLHRLVRIAVLGTVTTAATVSTWPAAIATSDGSNLAAIVRPTPIAAPLDATAQPSAMSSMTTIVASGRDTPLSIAVDLGDESLRDDIIAMNRSAHWSAGVFPQGMVVTIPVVDRPQSTPTGSDTYVVQPNDGMWNVAQVLLGDGARYRELGSLLEGQEVAPGVVFTAETRTIHPGWTFSRPASAALVQGTATYVVSHGDSLSTIAARHLGDPDRWTELWEANAQRAMPDGATFDDPNLILPGWHLDVPSTRPFDQPPPDPQPSVDEPDAPLDQALPTSTDPEVEATDQSTTPTPRDLDEPDRPVRVGGGGAPLPSEATNSPPRTPPPPTTSQLEAVPAPSDTSGGIWTDAQRSVWPTLAVGSLITAGLAATIRRARSRRLSQVRPGYRLAEQAEAAAGTEHAILSRAGSHRLDTITAILRSFTPGAGRHRRPPAVRAVQIGDDRIEVLLDDPEPLAPDGWTTIDGGHSWTHRFDEPLDAHRPLLTPALVTIGVRTDERGDEVLLDLETAGSVAITGERSASIGLARSIVLELASYPLGVSMDVSLIGIDVEGATHFDRVWTDTTIDRAVNIARRRQERQEVDGRTLVEARADLDEDDGAHDPHVFVVDTTTLADAESMVVELVGLCRPHTGTAVVLIGDVTSASERIIVDTDGRALWSGVDLRNPAVTAEATAEVAALLKDIDDTEPELVEADDFMTALLHPEGRVDTRSSDDANNLDDAYRPPPFDVLIQLMGEPRAHGIELSADQTELLALLTCLRHRNEIHIGLVHESVAPDRARKTIENRMSQLRRELGVGADGYDLLPEAAPGRGGRSHYLVSPLVLTDIDLLEHRYHASASLSSGDALAVLRDGLDLMRGPLLRSRRGYDFWPHSEGVIVAATGIVQAYACRLIELAAEADDPALVLRATATCGCVLDNPLAEFPIRQAEQAYAEASGHDQLLASVEQARRRLLEHIDNDDTFAEAG